MISSPASFTRHSPAQRALVRAVLGRVLGELDLHLGDRGLLDRQVCDDDAAWGTWSAATFE